MRRKLAAGNWKMNGTTEALEVLKTLGETHPDPACDILICPPATLLYQAAQLSGTVAIGAQDCHAAASGAHTGDLSAIMLKDAGASAVIVGHSERRQDHGESNETVNAKAKAALANGLVAIVCVGETLEQREAGKTLDIIADQLAGSVPEGVDGGTLVVAYEPVWAIGTGLVPEISQIAEVHDFMRAQLESRFGSDIAQGVRLLYGGSVKASNAAEIFAVSNVDGALVGGASLKAEDFSPIVTALETSK